MTTSSGEPFSRVMNDSAERIESQLIARLDDSPAAVFFCNVHMLMLANDDQELHNAMMAADLLVPDGVPVAWLQRRLGSAAAEVFPGYKAVEAICKHAAKSGKRVGLMGATEEILVAMAKKISFENPGLEVAFRYAPPFGSGSELDISDQTVNEVNQLGLYALFIGLGCPKQEKWIFRHSGRLNCSLLGVGAAFDWIAGTKPMPPVWMQRSGLGWLHRLMLDPARMWKRYFIYNSKFMVFAATKILFGNKSG